MPFQRIVCYYSKVFTWKLGIKIPNNKLKTLVYLFLFNIFTMALRYVTHTIWMPLAQRIIISCMTNSTVGLRRSLLV